ncbi:DMT family transporter [Bacillus taeanensis]|uniref:EamA/RhaT family transporter n=1 Tax=Bacillus taeanensis TaxID=273032 RepID=A0A366XTI3_9BACI|nr:DMT family transporter [Bacillus taeanensis]RBW68976.1 EamA/RhaT family transporter [Bacillus taeanensis]
MQKAIFYILLLLVMVIWGLNVVAIKIVVEAFSPVMITSMRIFTAFLVVMPILYLRKDFCKLTKEEGFLIFVAAVTGIFGHHFFLSVGLTKTTASNAGLILGLVPLSTSLLAMLLLGDRITLFKFLGIICGITGVSFVVLAGDSQIGFISVGDFYIFLAVITQAVSFIFIKKATKTVQSRLVTGYMQFIGALLLFIVSIRLEPSGFSTLKEGSMTAWIVFLASAVLATGLGHLIYNKAIHHLGAGETAIFINLSPFFALLGSAFFLGENIMITQVFGFFFIVVGVLLGTGALEQKYQLHKMKQYEYAANKK